MKQLEGMPANVTMDSVRQWITPRVSPKRRGHIDGVATIARKLAGKTAFSPELAELAGWLHDACKELKADELLSLAKEFYLALDPILEMHGHLLHGPVSAEVVKRELGINNRELLDAISQHTLGAIGMTDLSKVVFLADCLEPGRPKDYTDPIWEALDFDGAFNLDGALVVALDLGLKHLIDDGKPIHPKTVAVRNHYLTVVQSAKKKTGHANVGK
jgi:predicted HD superfamily hydrolase involved in NAD metabolism